MRLILFTIIFLASYPLFAGNKDLPKYYDMTTLQLQSLPYSKNIYVNATVSIPNSHKTSGYPSELRIYEKVNGHWTKAITLKSNPLLSTQSKIIFSGKVNLQSTKSEVAIDSTIYHCGKYCVINNFQGIAKRNSNKHSKILKVQMNGYLPTDKLKSI